MFSAAKREIWLSRIEDVLAVIDRVDEYLAKIDREAFLADAWSIAAVSYQLIVIAEATKAMAPGLAERHPAVPWRAVWGMRNILAHEYGKVRPSEVWQAAINLAPLRAAMLAERDWLDAQ